MKFMFFVVSLLSSQAFAFEVFDCLVARKSAAVGALVTARISWQVGQLTDESEVIYKMLLANKKQFEDATARSEVVMPRSSVLALRMNEAKGTVKYLTSVGRCILGKKYKNEVEGYVAQLPWPDCHLYGDWKESKKWAKAALDMIEKRVATEKSAYDDLVFSSNPVVHLDAKLMKVARLRVAQLEDDLITLRRSRQTCDR